MVLEGSGSTVQAQFGTGTFTMLSTGTVVLNGSGSTVNVVFPALASAGTIVVGGSSSTLLPKFTGFSSGQTNTAFNVATSPGGTVIAANTGRNYLGIVNDGANVVYLALGAAPTANSGLRLNASGGAWETFGDHLWTGQVQAIAVTAASTVTVMEF